MQTNLHARNSTALLFIAAIFVWLGDGVTTFQAAGAVHRPPPTNSISYSDILVEKAVCKTIRGVSTNCSEVASNKLSITGKLLLSGVNIGNFNAGTLFDLHLGSRHIVSHLGDDPKYTPGKKSATFVTKYTNAVGRMVGKQTVKLTWTATLLTATVAASTADVSAPGWVTTEADSFSGQNSGKITNAMTGSLKFDTAGISFGTVSVGGTVVTKHVTAKDHNIYTLSTVRISGKGFGTGPILESIDPIVVTLGSDTAVTNVIVGSQGGTITVSSGPLAGVTVQVPPGAFEGDTTITLSHNDSTVVPRSGTFSGNAISVHTDGRTSFEEPLQITIPFPDNGTNVPVPYFVETNGLMLPCQVTGIDRAQGTLTFETFHASLFTWLYAYVTGEGGHTTYRPATDGFQIVNSGSVYNPGGECFGISAFEQWFFANKGGGLYPKYMQDIPVPAGGTVKGQNIIATRAHTSVSRLWNSYWPGVAAQQNLTGPERFASIVNILDNTARPTILYLSDAPTPGTHAVLAYDHNDTSRLAINDPNFPGAIRNIDLQGTNLGYGAYTRVTVIGNGSLRTEAFSNIYDDAQTGFSGNGAAQVDVTSHTSGDHVPARNIVLSGNIASGQVLVDKLEVWLNQSTKFEQAIGPSGDFIVPINLVGGTNKITFSTKGRDDDSNIIDAPNAQLTPFIIVCDASNSVILVTLTWNTDDTDLDLYTIDPTGDYSSYFHHTTADGGVLDFDDTTGFGPEHWTLSTDNTVRWGETYTVRLHYYDDHIHDPGAAVPTRWTVSVLVNEGTPLAATYNFSGILAAADYGNDGVGDGGPDWAEVCTITPIMPSPDLRLPKVQAGRLGAVPRILVPMPSKDVLLQLKPGRGKSQ